jgi:hypothetical protein
VSRSQVPGLGNVPWFGALFRKKEDSSQRNEIIVLLTPHIIDNFEAADVIGKQALSDAKRSCLGVREGFSSFTRERIVTTYMQAADRAWQKFQETGNRAELDTACWNINMAAYIEPSNLKALRLKDRILTEKRGETYQVPNWTIWDTLQDRLAEMEETKAAAAATLKPAPADPKTEPPAGKSEAPAAAPEKTATSEAPVTPAAPAAAESPAAVSAPAPEATSEASAPAAPKTASWILDALADEIQAAQTDRQ